jgi:hypothetical protein
MKRYLSLLVIFFFAMNPSFAQSRRDTSRWTIYQINGKDTLYIQKPNAFDNAVKAGEYRKAIGLMKTTLKTKPLDQIYTYNLVCIYALVDNKDSAFYFLNLSLKTDSALIALADPDFYSIIQDPRWEKIKQAQADKFEKRNGKFKNRQLTLELLEMHMKDQVFFRPSQLTESKFGPQKNLQDSLTKLYQPYWDNNLNELKEIIQKYGWPMISEVGKSAAHTAFIVIQHGDNECQLKYEPIIEAAANKGEASWSDLALLIDRIRVHQNKPQLYGSQVKYNQSTKQYEPEPIEDAQNLDLRRSKVGLGPAANYYSNWKIKYAVKQNKE